MPLFEFDDGAATAATDVTGAGVLTFTDSNGISTATFSVSVTDPGAVDNQVTYGPAVNGGFLEFDAGFVDTGTDVFTLSAVDTVSGFSKFGGNASNDVVLNVGFVSGGTFTVVFDGTLTDFTAVVTAAGAYTADTTVTGMINKITFTASPTALIDIRSLDATMVCYLEGTGIATTRGRVAVEDLTAGDRLLTADGGETEVVWLGRQPVAPRFRDPLEVNPVCIRANAISDGVPSRDLYVSPDHAVEIDGLLYNAIALINGRSIYQVARMPLDGFNYWHIETEAHQLILAEDCPAESYLDLPDRSAFVNGAERADAPPIAEMMLPRVTSRRLVPSAVVARLADRADRVAGRRAA